MFPCFNIGWVGDADIIKTSTDKLAMSSNELDDDDSQAVPLPENHGDMKFSDLIKQLFNRLSPKAIESLRARTQNPTGMVKKEVVQNFVRLWRQQCGMNLFPFLRLILPANDRDRPQYGLKEKAFGELLMQIFGIDKDSADGVRLQQFESGKYNKDKAGNFAKVVENALKERHSVKKYSSIMINELNEILDELAALNVHSTDRATRTTKKEQQLKILNKLCEKQLNTDEWKWVTEIIVKNVKINMAEKLLLVAIHDRAYEKLSTCANLKTVCLDIADPDATDGAALASVPKPMTHFYANLASRPSKSTTKSKNPFDSIAEFMNRDENGGAYVEPKLDGERMLVHMQPKGGKKEKITLWIKDDDPALQWRAKPDINYFEPHHYSRDGIIYTITRKERKNPITGKREFEEPRADGSVAYMAYEREFKFLSRNGIDYTSSYGQNSGEGWTAAYIHRLLESKVFSIILDGEMCEYDPKTGTYNRFGTLKTAMKQTPTDDLWTPCPRYLVFDIVSLNGHDTTHYSLQYRKALLLHLFGKGRLFYPDALNRVDLVPFNGPLDDILPPFERIDNLSQIVGSSSVEPFKKDGQFYEDQLKRVVHESTEGIVIKAAESIYEHERSKHWIKLKPEFVFSMIDDIDLLIIGCRYGKGHRSGIRATFHCAVRIGDGDSATYQYFARIGGGFKTADYQEVVSTIGEDKFIDCKESRPPQHLMDFGHLNSDEQPQEWIRPADSIVIQVKASEIIEGNTPSGYTLRFPRFQRIREKSDKDYRNCSSLDEIKKLKESRNLFGNFNQTSRRAKGRGAKRFKIAGDVKLDNVDVSGTIFTGKTFHVPASQRNQAGLKKIIKQNGGTLSSGFTVPEGQNPKDWIFVSDKNFAEARAASEFKIYVVKSKYIMDCIEAERLLDIEPSHLLIGTQDQVRESEMNVDEFGDPYRREITLHEFDQLIKNIPIRDEELDEKSDEPEPSAYELELLQHELQEDGGVYLGGMAMLGFGLYLDESITKDRGWLKNMARLCGGKIVDSLYDDKLSHCIVDENHLSQERFSQIKERQSKVPIHFNLCNVEFVHDCFYNSTSMAESNYQVNSSSLVR